MTLGTICSLNISQLWPVTMNFTLRETGATSCHRPPYAALLPRGGEGQGQASLGPAAAWGAGPTSVSPQRGHSLG